MNKKILPEPAPLKKWAGTNTLVWFWGEANLQPMADGGGAKTSLKTLALLLQLMQLLVQKLHTSLVPNKACIYKPSHHQANHYFLLRSA